MTAFAAKPLAIPPTCYKNAVVKYSSHWHPVRESHSKAKLVFVHSLVLL